LAGQGAGAFVDANTPWYAYVFRDAGGAAAAPQGEVQTVTGYTSATGTFTTDAFTAAVATGDDVIIVSAALINSLAIKTRVELALPNAAPDAAGGLPISDAGGLDLDAMNTKINEIVAGELWETTVASVTSQTVLVLTAGPNFDTVEGCMVVLRDVTNNDYPAVRSIVTYVGSTKTLTIDAAAGFTVAAGDKVQIRAMRVGAAAAAADLDVYECFCRLTKDDANSTDRYTIGFLKNGAILTTGVTGPTLTVEEFDGPTTIITAQALNDEGSHKWTYTATGGARATLGLDWLATISATIGGSARTFRMPVQRDAP
jgi:hypothetical protein